MNLCFDRCLSDVSSLQSGWGVARNSIGAFGIIERIWIKIIDLSRDRGILSGERHFIGGKKEGRGGGGGGCY